MNEVVLSQTKVTIKPAGFCSANTKLLCEIKLEFPEFYISGNMVIPGIWKSRNTEIVHICRQTGMYV